jgi:5-methylcytosine-specific restriction endonuclease McrA
VNRTTRMKGAERYYAYMEAAGRLNERKSCGFPLIEKRVAQLLGVSVPLTKAERHQMVLRFLGPEWSVKTYKAERRVYKAERRARKAERVVEGFKIGKVDVRSDAFLESYEWRRLRMVVIKKRGARCECCGASPRDDKSVRINVDHVKPRRLFPELALVEENLQVLCNVCNHGKGNWDQTDWRDPEAPVSSSDSIN